MRRLLLLTLLVTGCDPATPEPDDPPPPAELDLFEGTRTVSFERIADLNNRSVLDLDIDVGGVSAAVVEGGDGTELWLDTGEGWREVFAQYDFAPNPAGPTAVCIRSGGERIFVGGSNGAWWLLDQSGEIVVGPRDYNVLGEDREIDPSWPTAQCSWTQTAGSSNAGFLMASFTNAFGTDGALLWIDGDRLETLTWERVRDGFQTQTATTATRVPTAYSGLLVSTGDGYTVRAGIQYGPSSGQTTEHTVENLFIYQDWQYDAWLIRDENPAVAAYGQPRAFGRHPSASTEVVLFAEPKTNSWAALVPPPPGYREPFGMIGMAVLDAPELSRTGARAIDVDADGHLWIGGTDGIGLMRSTEPVR